MRPLRVLHINNTAGVAGALSLAQREHGIEAIVMTDSPHIYGFKEDVLLNGNGIAQLLTMLRLIRWADIVHLHAGVWGRTKKRLFPLLSKGKQVVQHFHGTDLRVLGGYQADCIVATPDLLDIAPNAVWIPSAIDTAFFNLPGSLPPSTRKKMVIGIRVPPSFHIEYERGKAVLAALSKLKDERGDFAIRIASNIRHSDMPNFYLDLDIMIDDKIHGWIGLISVEAMAMSVPVVAHIRNDLASNYDPPVFRADGTVQSVVESVNTLLDDSESRKELRERGSIYAENEHHPMVMERRVKQFYARVMASE